MIEPIEITEACRYYDNKAEHTLVWFGGLHEPFLGTSMLEKNGFNGLYLIDSGLDWYTTGIAGMGDHDQSVRALRQVLERYPATFTFAGQSSGGYAALRYAHELNPTLCIAFAPQTKSLNGVPQDLTLPDVSAVYTARPTAFPIILHLSRSEDQAVHGKWDDWNQIADFMPMDNVTVVRHPYDMHAVSLPLYANARFYETIAANMQVYARLPRIA